MKEKQFEKRKISAKKIKRDDVQLNPHEPLLDTIILKNGKKIPCKVKTIAQVKISYTDRQAGSAAENKIIKNNKVARINFEGGQKEYFRQKNINGNPLLQFDFYRNGKAPRTGLSIFGYILQLILSFALIFGVPVFGFIMLASTLALMVLLNTLNYETVAFKVIRGYGKILSILFFSIIGILILALIIALAL